MKKTLILALAIVMIASAALISVGAETTAEATVGPLVITEILNNPDSTDYYEYMELMNIGAEAIDLYDYKFWYRSGSKLSEVPTPDVATSKWNVFAGAPGQNILQPGEIALVWFIHPSFHVEGTVVDGKEVTLPEGVEWFRKEIADADKASYSHVLTDYTGINYAYNVEVFKSMIKTKMEALGLSLPEAFETVRVIVCDVSIELETPTAENLEAGTIGDKIHFNLANCSETKAVKYYITDRDITTFDENTTVYAAAGVDSGAKWAGQSFQYNTPDVGYEMTYMSYSKFYTPGYLSDIFQPELINLRNSIDPNKYPETAIIVTTTEKAEDEVTTEEITNPPRVTTAPEKPSTTTKPNTNTTTKAPETTAAPAEGGCGGFTAAAQLFALVVAAAAFVVIKKKA